MSYVFLSVVVVMNLYLIYLLLSNKFDFLYNLVLINFISNIILTQVEIVDGITFLIRLLQLSLLVSFIIRYQIKLNPWISLLIFYCLCLTVYYHDLYVVSYMVPFLSFYLLFTCSRFLVDDRAFDKNVVKLAIRIILIGVIYLFVTLSFKIGRSMYSEEYTVGGLFGDRINIITYSMIILFGYLLRRELPKKNLIYIFLGFVGLIIVAKRLPLLILIVAIILFLFQLRLNLKKIISFSTIAIVILVATSFLPEKYGLSRITSRGDQLKVETAITEPRPLEYIVLPIYLDESSMSNILFGNSFHKKHYYRKKYLGIDMATHVGWITNIFFLGVMGILLYLSVLISTALKLLKWKNHDKTTTYYLIIPLIVSFLIHESIDNAHSGFPAMIIFLVLGKFYQESRELNAANNAK